MPHIVYPKTVLENAIKASDTSAGVLLNEFRKVERRLNDLRADLEMNQRFQAAVNGLIHEHDRFVPIEYRWNFVRKYTVINKKYFSADKLDWKEPWGPTDLATAPCERCQKPHPVVVNVDEQENDPDDFDYLTDLYVLCLECRHLTVLVSQQGFPRNR